MSLEAVLEFPDVAFDKKVLGRVEINTLVTHDASFGYGRIGGQQSLTLSAVQVIAFLWPVNDMVR